MCGHRIAQWHLISLCTRDVTINRGGGRRELRGMLVYRPLHTTIPALSTHLDQHLSPHSISQTHILRVHHHRVAALPWHNFCLQPTKQQLVGTVLHLHTQPWRFWFHHPCWLVRHFSHITQPHIPAPATSRVLSASAISTRMVHNHMYSEQLIAITSTMNN